MVFIIVSPYSPRLNTIGSFRWEKLAKYLSEKHTVYFVTSKLPDDSKLPTRSFDIGKSFLIELPLKRYRKTPENLKATLKSTLIQSMPFLYHAIRRLKISAHYLLEIYSDISFFGLVHDFKAYRTAIEEVISKANPCEKIVLVTTFGPWFSIKLGNFLKRELRDKVFWVADFRDPSFRMVTTKNFFDNNLLKWKTKDLLRKVDLITVVSNVLDEEYYGPLFRDKVFVLPNGHDDYFTQLNITLRANRKEQRNILKIAYTGTIYISTQDLKPFMYVLRLLTDMNYYFIYAGNNSEYVTSEFEKAHLTHRLINFGKVTHDESLRIQQESDLLLLIVYTGDNKTLGRGIRTGKVYEYLASLKPILAIAPHDWEMKADIEVDGVSKVFSPEETEEMANYLRWFAEKRPVIDYEKRKEVVYKYHYRNLAIMFEQILETLLAKKEMNK